MDPRQHSPSAERNREPILAVLQHLLAPKMRVLEVASGTGEHAAFFAAAMPGWDWQPTDPDAAARASVVAWCEGLANVHPPLELDAAAQDWPVQGAFDAIVAINMVHISPWEATLGLMAGAGRYLAEEGVLYTYGAYKNAGQHTASSNEQFERWLKERDARFGVRNLEDVEAAASAHGLALRDVIAMPANNLSLVFARQP